MINDPWSEESLGHAQGLWLNLNWHFRITSGHLKDGEGYFMVTIGHYQLSLLLL